MINILLIDYTIKLQANSTLPYLYPDASSTLGQNTKPTLQQFMFVQMIPN